MTGPLLTLPDYVGQRSASFKFELVNGVTGENLGEIHPLRDSPASITHDTSRTIKRDLTFSLGLEDSNRINTIRDRVMVSMLLGGQTFPLGRYLFADDTGDRWTTGVLRNEKLVDEMFVVDQNMERGFSSNQLVEQAIMTLLADIPNLTVDIEASGLRATGSWAAGTSRAKVLEALCVQGGYFAPWFDNRGVLRIIRSFDPADKLPTFDFDASNTVIRGSISETNDLLTAPNKFIVVSNGASGNNASVPAVGTYEVPNSAPHSIANRGFAIVSVTDMQVATPGQAQVAARTIGLTNTVFERTQLSTVPNPLHDGYDVIRWQGELWLELSWSMTLLEGEPMGHAMRKSYS